MNEKNVHKLFAVSLFLKGLNAALEIALGILALFTGAITELVTFFARNELVEDPTDLLPTHISSFLPHLAVHTQFFAASYLLSHGIIKIFLVIALFRNKAWAYPVSMLFLAVLMVYQIIRFLGTHSIFLLLLTLFDLLVLWLIFHEYRLIRKVGIIES